MYNSTLSQLLKSPWAIDPQIANLWLPQVAKIIKGESIVTADTPKKETQIGATRFIIDDNGNKVNPNDVDQTPFGSVGVVEINGPMIKKGNFFCWGSDELVGFAKDFDADPNIIGIIFKIDTGGGAVDAVAPYHDFFKNKNKPVIGLYDLCASAGVWVGSTCDKIYAENNISASIGSIGVMATLVDYRERLKELGIKEHHIYSSLSTFKNKDYHDALDGDYKEFKKKHLDPLAEKFQQHVRDNRKNLDESVEGILEGSMFYAEDAQNNGLSDGVASFDQVLDMLHTRASAQSFMNQ